MITTFSSNDPPFEWLERDVMKWAVDSPDADFAVFRLADVILMKAEAQLGNGDAAGAQATLNQQYGTVSLHSRANLPDFSLADITLDNILRDAPAKRLGKVTAATTSFALVIILMHELPRGNF